MDKFIRTIVYIAVFVAVVAIALAGAQGQWNVVLMAIPALVIGAFMLKKMTEE